MSANKLEQPLREMIAACAACFRVISTVPGLAEKLEAEFKRAGVKEGFGVLAFGLSALDALMEAGDGR